MGDSLARRERLRQSYWDLITALGGMCEGCVIGDELQIDHVDGRDWEPNKVSLSKRLKIYWDEFQRGVRLRVLCKVCNRRDGGYRRWKGK